VFANRRISLRKDLAKVATNALRLVVLLALVGCLPFPLGDPKKSQVDPKLCGYWASTSDSGDEKELVALLPFDQHTYVLEDLKLKKQDDKWQPQGPPQLFKAWLTQVRGQQFMTLEYLQQRLPGNTDQKVYPVLRLTTATDGLQVRLVKSDFEPMKNVKSSADVEAVISKELDNPDLYSGEGPKFRRLDPDKDKEMIQLIAAS
jgi:hypothetical protein